MPALPHPLNAPGPFHVTDDCIYCGQCTANLPEVFAEAPDGLAYVLRQPAGPELLAEAREAMERCPAESIVETKTLSTAAPGSH
ncbi:MAG: ferredoxin [Verrucomicrobia bacterium]|nr:ferredoxin [Verrucomicrobiota bacterium]